MPDLDNPPVLEPLVDAAEEQATEAEEQVAETVSEVKEAVADAVEEAPEAIESLQDRMIDAVTAQQQEAIEAVESTSQALMDVLSRARIELSDFVSERIRADLEAQQALLRCRSFDEVREVQVAFFRAAFDQYGGEAARLVRLGSEVATASFERARV